MNDTDKLLAAEAIRNTNATYWYAMDTRNWELLASIFTEDAVFDMRGERAYAMGEDPNQLPPLEQSLAEGDEALTQGAQNIAEFIKGVVENWVTVHHGAAPIIEILSQDSARAIWPMFDYIDDGKNSLKGYGHYHNQYCKVGEKWLISHLLLTRIRTDGTHPWTAE